MHLSLWLVFGFVSLLPAFLIAALAWFILGGTSGDDWETWMIGPCYLLPGLIVGGSLFLGLRDEGDNQQ